MSNWTRAARERTATALPIEHLLPDTQPSYVKSVVYAFGAVAIGALAIVILSGIVLAVFGPQWWHTNGVGHFFNSVHLWSVQIFFFFMVVHLWGTFCMGAWRDGRRWTWVFGAVTFIASIGVAFTGYLSQTNFDSQWIAVSAKDAMNGAGIGSFFNVLNFGQMYSFHIIVLPLVLVGLVGLHIIMVRLRGVVRPYPATGEQRPAYQPGMTQDEYYRGVKTVPYDLLREVAIVTGAVLVLTLIFAGIFSSPDEKPLTLQSVAQSDPVGFTTVALSELNGTSALANYGPPYNHGSGAVQTIGPFSPQELTGVSLGFDPAATYVLQPLNTVQSSDVQAAVKQYQTATAAQQSAWTTAYSTALSAADGTLDAQGNLKLATGDYGPLPTMFNALLQIARSGALDGLLLTSNRFYETDYTKSLLFLNESALPARAAQMNLLGTQWGMMNETGNYPGQAWLWLYTFWYQVPFGPFNGPNADIAVLVTMAILTALLVFVPFVAGLREVPRYLGIYRLIWRDYYRNPPAGTPASTTAGGTPVAGAAGPGVTRSPVSGARSTLAAKGRKAPRASPRR